MEHKDKIPFLCRIGFHIWGKWATVGEYGIWQVRYCLACGVKKVRKVL